MDTLNGYLEWTLASNTNCRPHRNRKSTTNWINRGVIKVGGCLAWFQ
jgi:hypothetical protein